MLETPSRRRHGNTWDEKDMKNMSFQNFYVSKMKSTLSSIFIYHMLLKLRFFMYIFGFRFQNEKKLSKLSIVLR